MRRWKSVLAVDSTHLFPAVSEVFIISLLTGKRASHRHLLEDISIDISQIFSWLTHPPSRCRWPAAPSVWRAVPKLSSSDGSGSSRPVAPRQTEGGRTPASPSPAVAGRVDLPQCRPLSARIHVQSRYAGCGLGRIVYHRVHT